jgi:plasmid stabilization system protein ParE
MAYRVNITLRAERDLEDLCHAIGAGQAALAWYRGFKRAILGLESYPNRCPATPESARLRHLLFGRKPHMYRAIFRISEKQSEVEVLHIRHSARQEIKADDPS